MAPLHDPFTHDHYRHIIQSALESRYAFIGFADLRAIEVNDPVRVCLLRHDCDNDLTAAAAIARLEEELGIRSTYFVMLRSAMYNLLSLPNAGLVREIVGRGHWLGLHFDEECYPGAGPAEMAAHVDRERAWLAAEFGVPVDVVSFHQPSRRVLDKQIALNCVNAYDLGDGLNVHYLSDSNTVWREGCPSEIFRARTYPRLQLLLHPEWWTAEHLTLDEKWEQMLRNNLALIQQSLLDRERAYTRRREIAFRSP